MQTDKIHYSNLVSHLTNAFIDTPIMMHPSESYAIACRLCRHFELDVSPVDILHAITWAEQAADEYFDSLDDEYIPF